VASDRPDIAVLKTNGALQLNGVGVARLTFSAHGFTRQCVIYVTSNITPPPAEDVPNASIDYIYERLTGLVNNGTYKFNGSSKTISGTVYTIATEWFGAELSIIKSGTVATVDSAAQTINIPARPAMPAVTGGVNEITGADGTMQYRIVNGAWQDYTPIFLQAGTYHVRKKSTSTSFTGLIKVVTVSAPSQIVNPSVEPPATDLTPPKQIDQNAKIVKGKSPDDPHGIKPYLMIALLSGACVYTSLLIVILLRKRRH
jgi:hypothetical protein